ncbi:MAG: lipid II flippase MurJ [Candidatus Eisenbacteria bacterium]|nr:lipid II flippase MurJ [Candidatus Eisenbacteria bacterium]
MSDASTSDAVGTKVAGAVGVITLGLVFGYLLSLVKAALVAAYLGTGWQMDVFLWSSALVSLFAALASGPLLAVLVPLYLSQSVKDIEKARNLLNAVLGLLFVSFAILSIVLVVGAPMAARLLGTGMGPAGAEGRGLAIQLVWMMLPVVLFSGVWTACQAILNAEKSFFAAALSVSFSALGVILALLVLGRARAVYAQAIGLSLGSVAQWALLMALLRRRGLGRRWTLNLRAEGMGQFFRLLWPLVTSQAFILCLPVVDRTIAAHFSPGSISALGYAQTLMAMSATMFLTASHTAILPFLSQQVAESGLVSFKRTFVPTIRVMVTLLTPLCVVMITLQRPVIQFIFERGLFDSRATALTAPAFAAYVAGVVPMAITFICARGFNALQDSKTNALVGVLLLVTVKLGMNVLLTRWCGYLGLAWATSASYVVTATVMLWVMRRRLGDIGEKQLLKNGGKTLIASCLGGLLAWWGIRIGGSSSFLQLALGGTLAVLGYGTAAYLLRLEDVKRLSLLAVQFMWNRMRTITRGLPGQ